jgi:hypothetical protein
MLVLSCLFLLALLESAESDGIAECLLNSTSAEGNTCQVTSCTAVTLVCGISCNSQDFAEVHWKKARFRSNRINYYCEWPLAKALPNYNNRTTIQFRADDVTEGRLLVSTSLLVVTTSAIATVALIAGHRDRYHRLRHLSDYKFILYRESPNQQ